MLAQNSKSIQTNYTFNKDNVVIKGMYMVSLDGILEKVQGIVNLDFEYLGEFDSYLQEDTLRINKFNFNVDDDCNDIILECINEIRSAIAE